MLITDLAVFRFDPTTRRAFVSSLHPGVEARTVVERTGFAISIDGDVDRTPAPAAEILDRLRAMDPTGVYLKRRATPS